MSDHHFSGDEELIRRLLAEEENRSHADLPKDLDLESTDDLHRVIDRLDSARRFEQRSLSDARSIQDAPGENRVASTIEHLASGNATRITPNKPSTDELQSTPKPSAPWQRAMPLLAAAALFALAVGLGQFNPRPSPVETPQLMGEGTLSIVRPTGPEADFGHFEWTSELTAGHWYVVTVYPGDIDIPMREHQLSQSDHLTETSWSLSATTTDTWPDRIYWEVAAFDSSGGPVTSRFAEASR